MEIYFVRHGETGGNTARRHQAEHTPLTFEGEAQARIVAEVVRGYEPTHLVTSSLVRAIQTASIIGEMCNLVPETSETFVELVRPSHLHGYHHRSMPSLVYYLQWYLGLTRNADGGETYQALRERFIRAQAYLAQFPADARVVVVSHSVFMNLFAAHVCREKPLTPLQAATAFQQILSMPNTHILPIRFETDSTPGQCAWSVNQ